MKKSKIWQYPPLDLLDEQSDMEADRGDLRSIAANIEALLTAHQIKAKVVEINLGPAISQYCLEIDIKTRISDITSLADEIALVSKSPTGKVKIEAPIPGRNLIGIEIPNRSFQIVSLKTMLTSIIVRKNKDKLAVPLGLDVSGNPIIESIRKMPHALVTGAIFSGKSTILHSLIASLLFRASPDEIKLILIDSKATEFIDYEGIPHLLTPVAVKTEDIISALKLASTELDRRPKLFRDFEVRNIDEYNELIIGNKSEALPIIIFVDEIKNLLLNKEINNLILKIIQDGHSFGIHTIFATQKQSEDVLMQEIEPYMPTRLDFYYPGNQAFLNFGHIRGCFNLINMNAKSIFESLQLSPIEIQGSYISKNEISNLVSFVKKQK